MVGTDSLLEMLFGNDGQCRAKYFLCQFFRAHPVNAAAGRIRALFCEIRVIFLCQSRSDKRQPLVPMKHPTEFTLLACCIGFVSLAPAKTVVPAIALPDPATLVAAVKAAGLGKMLSGPGSFKYLRQPMPRMPSSPRAPWRRCSCPEPRPSSLRFSLTPRFRPKSWQPRSSRVRCPQSTARP